jgi:hypothetical protein
LEHNVILQINDEATWFRWQMVWLERKSSSFWILFHSPQWCS